LKRYETTAKICDNQRYLSIFRSKNVKRKYKDKRKNVPEGNVVIDAPNQITACEGTTKTAKKTALKNEITLFLVSFSEIRQTNQVFNVWNTREKTAKGQA
jgi:hypothetical protein